MVNSNNVGIKDIKSNNLVIWPVPASENIYINETVKGISVFNNLGELVLKKSNTNFIDVHQLISGIYIITVQTEKGTFQKKTVISR
ncbi:MAG: T9SS type A sorting domain-containing protein [Bacteroidetes bacterium]|nr:T9SS type A sorting domain-containing protein [Bacteroidota bacterium]